MARDEPAHSAPPNFPPLVVFDCDYTLWACDVDTDVALPLRATPAAVVDARGRPCPLYRDVPRVFAALAASPARVAYASRTHDAEAAEAMLRAHGLWDCLRGERGLFQAYPSGGAARAKTAHFAKIWGASGFAARDTLFFDDMPDNVQVARAAGVTAVLLDADGLTLAAFERGVAEWRAQARR